MQHGRQPLRRRRVSGYLPGALARRRTDDGAVAVEFALILIPFLVLVFATIQYAAWFFSAQSGAAAAREAARRSAVGDLTCVQLASRAAEHTELESGTVTVTRTYLQGSTTVTDANVEVGDDVRITVVYQAPDFQFPFIPVPKTDGVRFGVSETAVARVETKSGNTVACP